MVKKIGAFYFTLLLYYFEQAVNPDPRSMCRTGSRKNEKNKFKTKHRKNARKLVITVILINLLSKFGPAQCFVYL